MSIISERNNAASTPTTFATALLKGDYETAGYIYPIESNSVSYEMNYLLGPLASAASAPYTLEDLMYAMGGLDKNDISLMNYEETYYIVANELQEYDGNKLGFYTQDDRVSVIKISFDRIGSEYYISTARLAYMDSSNFYGEGSEN